MEREIEYTCAITGQKAIITICKGLKKMEGKFIDDKMREANESLRNLDEESLEYMRTLSRNTKLPEVRFGDIPDSSAE